jgi:hypothetical protein
MPEIEIRPKGIRATPSATIIRPQKTIDLAGAVALELLLQVKDKDGRITEERVERGHSFLANFIKLLACSMAAHPVLMADGVALSLVDTGGVVRSGTGGIYLFGADGGLGTSFMKANAGVGLTTYGVLVGTDDGTILPKDINNYALGAKIAHGTGAGQLSYGDSSIVPVTHDSATYSYAGITRSFSNGSGAPINVKEVGLAAAFYWDTNTNRYFLLARDILGSPVAVPNGQALTASIRVKCYC